MMMMLMVVMMLIMAVVTRVMAIALLPLPESYQRWGKNNMSIPLGLGKLLNQQTRRRSSRGRKGHRSQMSERGLSRLLC